jgi:replicative superfamily II helicase
MYFVKIVSDHWLNCIKTVPISFQNLILPDKFMPPTPYNKNIEKLGYYQFVSKLFGIQDYLSDKKNEFNIFKQIVNYYTNQFGELNNIQNQCINSIIINNESIFIGASVGSGKTQLAEFAIWKKLYTLNEEKNELILDRLKSPILYLCANDDFAEEKYSYFSELFETLELDKTIKLSYFTGDFQKDKNNFQLCDIIISSFLNFDKFVSNYKLIQNLRDLNLV